MRTWQTIARWSPTSNYLILTIGIFLQPPLQGKLPLSAPGTSRTFQQDTSSLPRDQPVTGRFLTDLHAAFPEALVPSVKRARHNLRKTTPSADAFVDALQQCGLKEFPDVLRLNIIELKRTGIIPQEIDKRIPSGQQPHPSSLSTTAESRSSCTATLLSNPASSSASMSGRSRSVFMPKLERKCLVVT